MKEYHKLRNQLEGQAHETGKAVAEGLGEGGGEEGGRKAEGASAHPSRARTARPASIVVPLHKTRWGRMRMSACARLEEGTLRTCTVT